jgi:hypothetical protein
MVNKAVVGAVILVALIAGAVMLSGVKLQITQSTCDATAIQNSPSCSTVADCNDYVKNVLKVPGDINSVGEISCMNSVCLFKPFECTGGFNK